METVFARGVEGTASPTTGCSNTQKQSAAARHEFGAWGGAGREMRGGGGWTVDGVLAPQACKQAGVASKQERWQ